MAANDTVPPEMAVILKPQNVFFQRLSCHVFPKHRSQDTHWHYLNRKALHISVTLRKNRLLWLQKLVSMATRGALIIISFH